MNMTVKDLMVAPTIGKEFVDYAKEISRNLVTKDIKTAQLRLIFHEVRKIESVWEKDHDQAISRLNMLRPKMEYQNKRQKDKMAELSKVLSEAILVVIEAPRENQKKLFKRFVNFCESIIAYHKALGGKE